MFESATSWLLFPGSGRFALCKDAGPSSDVDFLVEMHEGRSVFDLVGFWQDLEALLGRKVDVVEPEGLHWFIRDKVLNEAVPL